MAKKGKGSPVMKGAGKGAGAPKEALNIPKATGAAVKRGKRGK